MYIGVSRKIILTKMIPPTSLQNILVFPQILLGFLVQSPVSMISGLIHS